MGIALLTKRTHWVNNNQFHGFLSVPKVLDLTRHETEDFRFNSGGAALSGTQTESIIRKLIHNGLHPGNTLKKQLDQFWIKVLA